MGKKDMTHEYCCECNDAADESTGAGKALGFLAVVTGVAAGVYLFAGERGRQNREKAREVYEKAREESNRQVEKVKDHISEKEYDVMVEEAIEKYKGKAKDLTKDELDNVKDELKKYWKEAGKKKNKIAAKGKKKVRRATKKK